MSQCRLCERPVYRIDLCSLHYSRRQRHGSPTAGPKPDQPKDFAGLGVLRCGICGGLIRDHKITETCL